MRPYLTHRTGVVAAAVVGVVTALMAPVPPASGETTTLCTGYQRCAQEGKSSSGYARAGDRMYWQMYSGHNCTNYVAYRMVRKGMANRRPWSGSGNATHWGTEMPRRTDQKPAVGAVAWWKAGTSRGGSTGHVAYVERVVSRSQIVVSQDSWSGDFSWARITKGHGWPTGFIHLKDTPLRGLAAPRATGPRRVGQQLVATRGSWSPAPTSVTYQWLADGRPVRGADSRTLRLTHHLLGKRMQVRAVGSRLGYPRSVVTSQATKAIQRGHLDLARRPRLTGHPRLGRTLRLSPGFSSPHPRVVRYQWMRDGRRIFGATGRTYRLGRHDLGSRVRAQVSYGQRGYEPLSVLTGASARVMTAPRVRVAAERKRHAVLLTVRGRAGGRALGTGVVVTWRGRVLDRATMRHGKAVLRLGKLPPGRRLVRVVVRATPATDKHVASRTVRSPR